MRFATSHIPSRRLTDFKTQCNIQIIAFEINLWKEKWLVASSYITPSHNKMFILHLTDMLEYQSIYYKKVIILRDFNLQVEIKVMKDFL